jgi:DNA polymerase-4
VRVLWNQRAAGRPMKVAVTLTDLVPARSATPSLFDHDQRLVTLCHIMDRLNRVFGPNTVYFGGMYESQDAAPMRIPFNSIPVPDPAVHSVGRGR